MQMLPNKLLQLSLMDCAEASLPRSPRRVDGAAEPRRYVSVDPARERCRP